MQITTEVVSRFRNKNTLPVNDNKISQRAKVCVSIAGQGLRCGDIDSSPTPPIDSLDRIVNYNATIHPYYGEGQEILIQLLDVAEYDLRAGNNQIETDLIYTHSGFNIPCASSTEFYDFANESFSERVFRWTYRIWIGGEVVRSGENETVSEFYPSGNFSLGLNTFDNNSYSLEILVEEFVGNSWREVIYKIFSTEGLSE